MSLVYIRGYYRVPGMPKQEGNVCNVCSLCVCFTLLVFSCTISRVHGWTSAIHCAFDLHDASAFATARTWCWSQPTARVHEHEHGEYGQHEDHGEHEHEHELEHKHGQSAAHQHDEYEQRKERAEQLAGGARDARRIS